MVDDLGRSRAAIHYVPQHHDQRAIGIVCRVGGNFRLQRPQRRHAAMHVADRVNRPLADLDLETLPGLNLGRRRPNQICEAGQPCPDHGPVPVRFCATPSASRATNSRATAWISMLKSTSE